MVQDWVAPRIFYPLFFGLSLPLLFRAGCSALLGMPWPRIHSIGVARSKNRAATSKPGEPERERGGVRGGSRIRRKPSVRVPGTVPDKRGASQNYIKFKRVSRASFPNGLQHLRRWPALPPYTPSLPHCHAQNMVFWDAFRIASM